MARQMILTVEQQDAMMPFLREASEALNPVVGELLRQLQDSEDLGEIHPIAFAGVVANVLCSKAAAVYFASMTVGEADEFGNFRGHQFRVSDMSESISEACRALADGAQRWITDVIAEGGASGNEMN